MFENGQCLQLANGTTNCLIIITTRKRNGPDEKAVSAPRRKNASRARWTSDVGVLGTGGTGIARVPSHSDSMIPLPDAQVFLSATVLLS